jgi:putative Mg2+ transporter-C (MgtC) family protein
VVTHRVEASMDKRIRLRQAAISAGDRYPVQHDNSARQISHDGLRTVLSGTGWLAEHVWLWAAGGANKPNGIFAVNASIDQAAISLGIATLLGGCIGFERQWRQRMAGLRTNTLVAIGAASFVVFSGLFPGEDSPTRMAAQVVSGIGFLGAGIIFREGLHVTGLNTAATLWCSAAVGLLAGSGHPLHAALATGFVVLVNLTLRPLVRIINRQPITQAEADLHYRVRVVCRSPEEAHIRALLLRGTGNGQLSLRRLESNDLEESGRVEVTAELTAQSKSDAILEQVVGRLSLEPTVSAASWSVGPMLE